MRKQDLASRARCAGVRAGAPRPVRRPTLRRLAESVPSSSSLISPVGDQLTDLALWEAKLGTDPQVVACSLVERRSGCRIGVLDSDAGTGWW